MITCHPCRRSILVLQISYTTLHSVDTFLALVVDAWSYLGHAILAGYGGLHCIRSILCDHLGDLGIKEFIRPSYEAFIVVAST